MNHIVAGIIVGGAWLAVVSIAVGLTTILNWLVGPAFTVAIFATTVIVMMGATLIDWYTERRR